MTKTLVGISKKTQENVYKIMVGSYAAYQTASGSVIAYNEIEFFTSPTTQMPLETDLDRVEIDNEDGSVDDENPPVNYL